MSDKTKETQAPTEKLTDEDIAGMTHECDNAYEEQNGNLYEWRCRLWFARGWREKAKSGSAPASSGWINCEDGLPPEGEYVLARHNRGTWIDSGDQENVNCVVVKLVKGISKKERENLDDTDKHKNSYYREDEFGNNKKPYCWNRFGPDSFNGQSIVCWMRIPD